MLLVRGSHKGAINLVFVLAFALVFILSHSAIGEPQKTYSLGDKIIISEGNQDISSLKIYYQDQVYEYNGNLQNDTDKLAVTCYTMMKNMYKKEYSEILKIFYGIHVSEIISNTTNETLSARPEPFSVLSLSIPQPMPTNSTNHNKIPSLYDCFDLYCESEILSHANGNAWFNDETKQKEDVQRKISFWSLPNVLIIDLKRWSTMNLNKNQGRIDIPLHNADFSKYVKGYNPSSYVYDLYAVCNHGGSSRGGHYTANIKNANNKWYIFNDTAVNEIKEEQVISAQSYCLFYRKKV